MRMEISVFAEAASTPSEEKAYDIDGSYPYVFVHGMGAWGSYNSIYETVPNWGGASMDGTDRKKNITTREGGFCVLIQHL